MQEKNIGFPGKTSEQDYRTRLIQLGVAEHLLQSTEDFALLYEKLRTFIGRKHFGAALLVREHWQVQALGGCKFNGYALNNKLNLRDNWGASPAHYAACSGNNQALDWIKSHDPEALKLKDNYGRTPIHFAASSGQPQALDWIKSHAPEALMLKDDIGTTPIHSAAWSGNPQALHWIKSHAPEALMLQDDIGITPIHSAAWSGNPQALHWINSHAPEALKLKDNGGVTSIHYAAWSGNPQALNWIKSHAPEALKLEDDYGATPIHYAAWSANPQALDWIKSYAPEELKLKETKGRTPMHYAAWSGNPEALDWIKSHAPEALKLEDNSGRTPIHCAATLGNPQALEWIYNYDPEALELKDNWGLTPIDHAAYSGNAQGLNQALLHKMNPETWTLPLFNSKVNNTLLQALETNYTLTTLENLDKSGMSEEEKSSIVLSLSRNRAIKDAKVRFIAFCQGTNQKESFVSLLPPGLELHRSILKQLLPEGVDVERVLTEVMQKVDSDVRRSAHDAKITARNAKALALIDREIKRLLPASKEHNTLLGIPLHSVYENSDVKIAAFRELNKLVAQGGECLMSEIHQWENTHALTLARHRNLGSRFFSQGPTQSHCAIKAIKGCLGIKDPTAGITAPQRPK